MAHLAAQLRALADRLDQLGPAEVVGEIEALLIVRHVPGLNKQRVAGLDRVHPLLNRGGVPVDIRAPEKIASSPDGTDGSPPHVSGSDADRRLPGSSGAAAGGDMCRAGRAAAGDVDSEHRDGGGGP